MTQQADRKPSRRALATGAVAPPDDLARLSEAFSGEEACEAQQANFTRGLQWPSLSGPLMPPRHSLTAQSERKELSRNLAPSQEA